MIKRVLASLLSLITVVSLLPLPSAAAGEGEMLDAGRLEKLEEMDRERNTFVSDDPIDISRYPAFANFGTATADMGDYVYYEEEPNNSKVNANYVYFGDTFFGSVSNSDLQDYYRFTVNERCKVTILALAQYRSLVMSLWNNTDDLIATTVGGSAIGGGVYGFKLSGTLNAGDYYLWMIDTGNTMNAYEFFIMVEPEAPVIKATNHDVLGVPWIHWEWVEGAEEYEIYRATSKDGKYSKVGTTVGSSFQDGSAKLNKVYYYKVRSLGYESYKSSFSNIVKRRCVIQCPRVTVKNDAATGKIKVTSSQQVGAVKYAFYRSTSLDGEYKLLKTTSKYTYTDTSAKAGKKYYYKVVAVHENPAANSMYSSAVSGICDLPRPEVKAKNTASSGKIKLTWKEISGAEGYAVYRARKSGGDYSKIATVQGTGFTDKTAQAGKKYYYKVVAIHKNTSANSAKSKEAACVCDLPRPDVSIKRSKNGDPKLTWDRIEGAAKYYVYRAASKNGDYEKIKSTTSSSYTDKSAKAGKTYYYKVKAIHSNSGAHSAYSSVDSIKAK